MPARLRSRWREELYVIIFRHDTPSSIAFDVVLFWLIGFSVMAVMLESVGSIRESYGTLLFYVEWTFTALFTLEFLARLVAVEKPWRYLFSFYGLIDLLALVPTYFSFLWPGAQSLLMIRAFRLLRVFRVFKLGQYVGESNQILAALAASRKKITVFVTAVVMIVLTVGTLMYLIEGEANGFTSIPKSTYWAIVTLTTVGYGDIAPKTALGQLLASALMILGYGVIAVPTGIVTAELTRQQDKVNAQRHCVHCAGIVHDGDAAYCKRCGAALAE